MSLLPFAELLDLLGHDDHVALCSSFGGIFSSQVVTVAHAKVYQVPQDRDAWYSANPMQGPPRLNAGRGDVSQVTRLVALYADLDVKPGGLDDFPAAWAVVSDLSTTLHVRPSAVTLSGNGLQPYWPIEDTISGLDAAALLRRWGRLVRHYAGLRGGKVDSVYDLTRILRIPGSLNHKAVPAKPVIALADTGRPLAAEEVEDTLQENGVTEQPEDRHQVGDIIAPATDWAHQQHTCSYVNHMVAAWATDVPSARHPWLVSQATRIAAAHRHGCFTEADHTAALLALRDRFQQLLATPPQREEAPGEFADAVAWGQDLIACKTDTEVHAELGAHTHLTVLRGGGGELSKEERLQQLIWSVWNPENSMVRKKQLEWATCQVLRTWGEGLLPTMRQAGQRVGIPDAEIDQIFAAAAQAIRTGGDK